MKILVTGGAGYIGSHTVLKLMQENYEVAVFDSLEKGHKEALTIIEEIVGKQIPFYQGSLLNREEIDTAMESFKPDGIIHFGAYIEVGESVNDPLKYYQNNIVGGLNLLYTMKEHKVHRIVFSSTAAIFGQPEEVPIKETTAKQPINPYGRSKLMFEQIMDDLSHTSEFNYVALRYFNACGADLEGRIGEDHSPESHLIPLVMEAAQGKRAHISIYGTDYKTKDGTCIRDYVHVLDLADAHIKAIQYLVKEKKSDQFNLGSSEGYSVREIIEKVREITQKEFTVVESERRPGDPAVLIADNKKAKEILGWEPNLGLSEIIESAWTWEVEKGSYRY